MKGEISKVRISVEMNLLKAIPIEQIPRRVLFIGRYGNDLEDANHFIYKKALK